MQNEITNISTMGSCSSRNIFNSNINKNYKNYFKINHSIEAVNLISLMSNKFQFDENLINSDSKYDNLCVYEDLSKSFLDFIKEDNIDYLIFDTYCDVVFGVISIGKKTYVTDSNRLKHTDFYQTIPVDKKIHIINDFKSYFQLWCDSCHSFFDFIDNNCNNIKIILNCSRSVYKCLDEQNNFFINDNFKKENIYNKFRDILDEYILENFDVEVLEFDNNTLASSNHIFGLHPTHYVSEYYLEKNRQLLEIINRNKQFNKEDNLKIRLMQHQKILNSFKDDELANKKIKESKFDSKKILISNQISDNLNKYNTARIDIKNFGNNNTPNSVKVKNITDYNPNFHYPNWFKDSNGEGVVIQSQSNFLQFNLECIGDGELNIFLKGIDKKLNGKRIPIYIEYKKLLIDGENVIDENKIVSHNDFYVHKLNIHDGQILSIYLEWKPLS